MKKHYKLTVAGAIIGVTVLTLLLYDKYFLFLNFLNPIFRSLNSFVACYCISLVLVAAAFIWGRPDKLARMWILVGLALAFAFPFLAPFMYGEHQIGPRAAAGYKMEWVTQPDDKVGVALKAAQRWHESAWCIYTLYGWDTGNALYYESSCQSGYLRYDSASGERRRVSAIPEDVQSGSAAEPTNAIIGQGYAADGFEGFDPSTTYPVVAYSRAVSPDGQWLAAAIREYYGPHDIVILRAVQ